MGHRLSKTTITDVSNTSVNNNDKKSKRSSINKADKNNSKKESNNTSALSLVEPSTSGPTINVITDSQTFCFETRSESSSSSNGPRQIIIKIQLAKMEAGENDNLTSQSAAATSSSISSVTIDGSTSSGSSSSSSSIMESNNNLNVERSNMTVNAISFQRNIACDTGSEVKLNNLNGGSSMMLRNNNNNNFASNFTAVPFIEENSDVQNLNIMVRQVGNCQIVSDSRQGSSSNNNNNDSTSNRSSTSSSEFSDAMSELVPEGFMAAAVTATTVCGEDCKNHCCRRKKSSPAPASSSSTSSSSSSAYPSKWIYCKGTCVDALKKLRPGCSKKQNQLPPSNSSSSTNQRSEMQPLAAALPNSNTSSNHLALWSPDVIIPLASSPQIVVVQYPTASQVVALGPIANLDQHAIRLMTGDLPIPTTPESSSSMSVSPCSTASSAALPNGTTVHSQVDYMHWLVPDLEKITKSSYYWGKMDRYEAERLLEGKPEGTFLLRDSAQEEYLFSVTFRKYGRSLHARIEQFNHEFSFDCHDPGVYTAPTVTGLLEHYKDPTIVMFFEPMLTYPLHRNKTFSLQQLCRATIVSQTTYDGISELEIPLRLKAYLKEYHYKQRVRVKPFDETLYNCA